MYILYKTVVTTEGLKKKCALKYICLFDHNL